MKITSLAEAVMAETTLAEFGFTAVSKAELAALREENARLREALETIANYEYRGGRAFPLNDEEINKPSAADLAQTALGIKEQP